MEREEYMTLIFGKIVWDKNIECLADKGYQEIQKLHKNSRITNKKKKNQELSLEEKEFNCQLSRERIVIEPIHRSLKIFRILSSRYRKSLAFTTTNLL